MQNHRRWGPVILLYSVMVSAEAADHEAPQAWSHGSYDKNIAVKQSVPPSIENPMTTAPAAPAYESMGQAKAKASAENKTIFLHFGASWCGWCRKLDTFLRRPDIKLIFEKHFVLVKLVVQERELNKAMENPGADVWLSKLGGPAGLPYFAFLDAQGGLIVNSKRPTSAGADGEGIGYPAEPEEIDWFLQMIRKAAPRISEEEVRVVQAALRETKTP
jgi:thioredoxin-related protein